MLLALALQIINLLKLCLHLYISNTQSTIFINFFLKFPFLFCFFFCELIGSYASGFEAVISAKKKTNDNINMPIVTMSEIRCYLQQSSVKFQSVYCKPGDLHHLNIRNCTIFS